MPVKKNRTKYLAYLQRLLIKPDRDCQQLVLLQAGFFPNHTNISYPKSVWI